MKKDFIAKELKDIDGNENIVWSVLPTHGHSGGILIGVKDDLLEVEQTVVHQYCIQ